MGIGDLLDRRAIAAHANATGKRQALAVVAEVAARAYGLDAGQVLDRLLERESAGSTGIGYGVAAPHARLLNLDRLKAVFVRLDQPIDFGAMDDQPVDLVVALLAPESANADHLRALARLARTMRRRELREALRQAKTADAIHALLADEAASSAA